MPDPDWRGVNGRAALYGRGRYDRIASTGFGLGHDVLWRDKPDPASSAGRIVPDKETMLGA
jgi:hypothetical protein